MATLRVEDVIPRPAPDGSDSGMAVVLLEDTVGRRVLPIWLGRQEATAIAVATMSYEPQRPLTYQLAVAMLEGCGAKVDRVEIKELRGDTFHASVTVTVNGRVIEFDARPSDVLPIAVYAACPIMAADAVMERASFPIPPDAPSYPRNGEGARSFIENIEQSMERRRRAAREMSAEEHSSLIDAFSRELFGV